MNGLMRAVESDFSLVVTDGDRTRYQFGLYFLYKAERSLLKDNLGGTAGFPSCPNRDRALFF